MASVISEFEQHPSQRTSVIVFLVVAVLFLVAFNYIPVPSQEYADQAVEELMLERVILESIRNVETEESEDNPEPIEKTPEPKPTQDILSEDLAQLMEAFDDFSLSQAEVSSPDLTKEEKRDLVLSDQNELDLESNNLEQAFGGRSLDLTPDLVKNEDRRPGTTRTLRPSLLPNRGVSDQDGLRSQRNLTTGSSLDLRATNQGNGNLLESSRNDDQLSTQGRDIDFAVPINELLDWMRANQGPLDPGVRALFQYLPGNLTAKTEILANGASYGLQLMHAPGGGETHIAVIDNKEIFYFIDLRMQQRASRFEKGTVRRDEELRVTIVESEDFSARSEEALRALKLFVDWWVEEKAKMNSNG